MLALSVIFIVPDKSTEFQKVYCMVYYFIISHHECMRDRQDNMVTHTLNSRASTVTIPSFGRPNQK